MPEGLRPRGGKLPPHEFCDLLNRGLAREAGGLAVSTAAGLPGDRRDVQLVDARPQADPPGRSAFARRLTDEHGHVGSLDRAEIVDDSLRVRLRGADLMEVRAQEEADDDAPALVNLRSLY